MNLLDLLKRDLKSWPKGGYLAYQSGDGRVFFLNGVAEWDGGGWTHRSDIHSIDGPLLIERADDHRFAFVCHSQWFGWQA